MMPLRLAMWSGPRNISTALMRSWGNRNDCTVVDEPLYAHYLSVTRKAHPGADEVIATGETNWQKVVARLTSEPPSLIRRPQAAIERRKDEAANAEPSNDIPAQPIDYQKHMTHHLLPHIDRQWLLELTNCFLIRDPREVLASYAKVIETPSLADTGFPQQAEIFNDVRERIGGVPPVIDAADVLRDPRRTLGLLCEAVGVDFQEAMLAWPPGPRATDGVWAKYWYAEVDKSTGFRPYQPKAVALPPPLESLARQCLPHYELLYPHRLR